MLLASAEMEIILGSIRPNVNRAVCLGGTCLKVKPAVGSCCRYVTGLLLLYFLKGLCGRLNLSVIKWHLKPQLCEHRVGLAPSAVKQFLSWSVHHKNRSWVSKMNGFLLLH